MKITLKKVIQALVPYGIIKVYQYVSNVKRLKSGEVVEPRAGLSPYNSPFPPPSNVIPESKISEYTLNGKMKVLYSFADSRALNNERQ